MNLNQLLELNSKATRARESGDMVLAKQLFDQIATNLPHHANPQSDEDKNAYVGLCGELLIYYRHVNKYDLNVLLSKAKEVYGWANKNSMKPPYLGYAIRGVSNILLDMGKYEEAEHYLKLLISNLGDDTAYVADSKAHLALCLFRQSHVDKALDLINESLQVLQTSTNPNAPVWLSNALMVKALILRSQDQISEAKDLATQALKIAKENKLRLRTIQAQSLVDLLSHG